VKGRTAKKGRIPESKKKEVSGGTKLLVPGKKTVTRAVAPSSEKYRKRGGASEWNLDCWEQKKFCLIRRFAWSE